ncbi:glycine betaine/proline transport system ATP-binding protein [Sedimentibacter acidaminivorans]|uniref:Quaternary amine transport ATP-binding protein n=1 Tax=Sedimentibacter acidaminivorans TaxID=913099 RepID=A0ABS4GD88_9FIRM|nr:glycine betaine/L-proline ABC transporter ATP-binding protein [Sedimentibacter acidaminivorans]MBP1925675.1 glycine betaine/proline transport system ATP-binding protein [Sedimentibacter acidaminivorans]
MLKIEVKKLTKVFGKNPKLGIKLLEGGKTKADILKETGMTVGVNQVSFKVFSGEIFVIMGLSGSGKSTLVRLINRLIEPSAGSVLIDGEDLAKMDKAELIKTRRKKLSMVFQKFGLFPHRTILENTEYGLEVQGFDKSEMRNKALNSLKMVGLLGYEEQYPSQLSGGMQQRVGLARALATDTDILLMDEAFSALDPLIRKEMQDELIDLQSSMQKTIIFITHDLDEALKLGDRIALMKDGVIVQIGTPEEIMTSPANDYVKKFVQDVDRSKVLTAQNVMIRPETIQVEKDGPRTALQRMMQAEISSIYATNKNKELIGIVTADAASEAIKSGNKNIYDIIEANVPLVSPDLQLNDLFNVIYNSQVPVAVVEDKKLIGIIIRGAVLAALAGNEVNHDDTNTPNTHS